MKKFDLLWDKEILAVHFSSRRSTILWYLDEDLEPLITGKIGLANPPELMKNEFIFVPKNSDITKEEFRGNSIKVKLHKPFVEFDTESDAVLFKMSYR